LTETLENTPMRRFLLTAVLSLATMGTAMAAPRNMDRVSRMQADLAQACRSDCLQQAARPGAHPSAAQACQVRCGAGQSFARQEGRSQAVVSGRGVQQVAQRPVMAAAPQQSHGVIYAARSPSAGFGMVVGEHDRLAAFRTAEQRCTQAGPGCRVIAEFTSACGAVAQGVRRSQWAIIMTSDASTFNVMSTSAGKGATREAAEADALAECRAQDPRSQCRIAAVQCGRQG
jgi:hypothetical protein